MGHKPAVGGLVGDACGQLASMGLGWQKKFNWWELAFSGGLGAIGGAIQGRLSGGCFTAGTLVSTERGLVPIERIRKGDKVWSRNPRTGKNELEPVTDTFIKHVQGLAGVTLSRTRSGGRTETIHATYGHPFYVPGQGWVGAAQLKVGERVASKDGRRLFVRSVHPHRRPQGYTVYNFTVRDDHSYFVGQPAGSAWVHNAGQPFPVPEAVAFGLTNNLNRFKQLVPNAISYGQLGLDSDAPGFADELIRMMNDSVEIHFNLTNMVGVGGPDGMVAPDGALGNYRYPPPGTNWELQRIWSTPELKAKATFYQDGKIKTHEEVPCLP